jgi:hypothetical protein
MCKLLLIIDSYVYTDAVATGLSMAPFFLRVYDVLLAPSAASCEELLSYQTLH